MPRKRTNRQGQIGDYWLSKRPNSPYWCRTRYEVRHKSRQTKRTSLGTTDFREAELKLAAWVTKNQTLRDVRPEDMPLENVLVRFFENKAKGSKSETQVKIALRFWSEYFSHADVTDLTPDSIESFIDWLKEQGSAKRGKPYANDYINRILASGRAALYRAHKRGELKYIPSIQGVKKSDPYDRHLSPQETAALFDACDTPHMLVYLILAFNTAARPEAILELKKDQIDFENRLIRLNPLGREQTKKYRPTIPLTDMLLAWLQEAEDGHFVQYFGRPIKCNRKGFNALRRKAGISKDVCRKTIRHTVAVELRKRGVSKWEVEGFLGHRGEKSTTDVYAKYAPDYLGKAVKALDAYFNELRPLFKRPLNLTRLKELRLSCVRVTDKGAMPEKTKPLGCPRGFDGGAGRDRTDDLYNAIVALSQLSYGPKSFCAPRLGRPKQFGCGACAAGTYSRSLVCARVK